MKLNAIHHVAIIVSDIQAAKDFYVHKLGLNKIAAPQPWQAIAQRFCSIPV